MKRTFKRTISLVLALVILLSLPMTTLQASALFGLELDRYTDTDYSEDNYIPYTEGFYGYLAVRMENDECTGFNNLSLPVLVKDGQVLVSASAFTSLSSKITWVSKDNNVAIKAFHKTVFLKQSAWCNYCLDGSHQCFYTNYELSTSCVLQDDELWIPLQDICLLLGMSYYGPKEELVVISQPQEDIIDTYLDIMDSDTGCFDFRKAYMNDEDPELQKKIEALFDWMEGSSHLIDNLDGMLNLELDKFSDSVSELVTVGLADSNMSDLSNMDAVMETVLKASMDEIGFLSAESTAFGTEFADFIINTADVSFEDCANWYSELTTIESKLNAACGIEVKARFSKPLESYAEKCATASKYCKAADTVMEITGYALSAYELVRDVGNQDQLAVKGMSIILDDVSSSTHAMSSEALSAANLAVSTYSGETGSALAYWLGGNIDRIASSVIHAAGGASLLPLDTYDLFSDYVPVYADTLDAAESFREMLIAMELEQDVRTAFMASYATMFGFTADFADDELLNRDLAALYAWLKVRYVTRLESLHALNNMQDNSTYAFQEQLLQQDAKWLAAVSSYTDGGYIDPTEMQEALHSLNDTGLCDYVIPAYVRVHGTIIDGTTGEPVDNVSLHVSLGSEGIYFDRTVNGAYEYYLPLEFQESLCSESSPNVTAGIGDVIVEAKHEDYEDSVVEKSSDYVLVSFDSGSVPQKQYEIDIDIVMGEQDYWDYIHDTLLPELGYSGLTPVWDKDVTWNGTSDDYDILAAEVLDMNADGTDDMLLYLVNKAEIYADLYTRIDGKITLLGETMIICPTGYLWLGTMEINGETFLVDQYADDMGSAAIHNINFYRYGDNGLELAANYGFYPGAASRGHDYTYGRYTNFFGVTEDTETNLPSSSTLVESVANDCYLSVASRFGLPAMSAVKFQTNERGTLSILSFWESDGLNKTLSIWDDFWNTGNYSFIITEYTPYLEEMAKRDTAE